MVMVVASFPVMSGSPLSRPRAQLTLDDGACAYCRADHQRRPDGAPQAKGRYAGHHASHQASAPPPARCCSRACSRTTAAAIGTAPPSGWRPRSPSPPGSLVAERADERTWRTLPSEISIARARLPAGAHTVTLQTPEGAHSARLNLSGRYAVVDLRLLRNQLFVSAFSGRGAAETSEQKPQPRETPK